MTKYLESSPSSKFGNDIRTSLKNVRSDHLTPGPGAYDNPYSKTRKYDGNTLFPKASRDDSFEKKSNIKVQIDYKNAQNTSF